MKKILSIFLALCMIVTMIPGNALADETLTKYDIWVGGVQVTSGNKDNVTGDGISGITTYDPTSSTLTLNGVTITEAYNGPKIGGITSFYGIYADTDNLNIVLIGNNTITGKDFINSYSGGIYTSNALTLSGSGSLSVSGGTGAFSVGIHSLGNLTISSGTITASSAVADQTSIAIYCSKLVKISDGAVAASANTALVSSYGMISGDGYTITGGTVNATGKIGLHANITTNPVAISGGVINATGTQAGILGAVTVMGGTVTVKGDAKALDGSLTTSGYTGCTVTASTNKNGDDAGGYIGASLATYKYIKVEPAAGVAQIGTTNYLTLQEAVDAAAEGQTIKLLDNITLLATVTIPSENSRSFILDLNGKTLRCNGSTVIQYQGTGTLTIADSGSSGMVIGEANTIYNFAGGTVHISGGTVSSTRINSDTIINRGTVRVSGGIIRRDAVGMAAIDNYGTVTVSGGTIESNNVAIYNESGSSSLLSIPSGSVIIKGGNWALNAVPDLTGYDNVKITASKTKTDGTETSEITKTDIDTVIKVHTYKYLKFEPAPATPAPTVTAARISISGATGTGGAYKIGDTVKATWNNTVAGDNNSGIIGVTVNFSQFGGGTAVAATNSSGVWTASYTIPSGNIDAMNGNVSVTVTDNAGNTTTTADTTNATVDNKNPSVISVSVPGAGTYTTGQTLDFTVSFSEAVTVNTAGGTPYLSPIVGSQVKQAIYAGGSGTSSLLFRYTIKSGDSDSDGITIGALNTNGGTLRDNAGNDAVLTLNSVGNTSGILVDTSEAPYITGQPSPQTANEGQSATFSVAANGTGLIYMWQVDTGSGFTTLSNGSTYSGTTTATLTITAVTAEMNGYQYRAVVSGTIMPAVNSNSATLMVNAAPTYTISGTIKGSDTGSGIASASVWLKSGDANVGSPVLTDTNGAYTISNVSAGTYSIVVGSPGYNSGTISSFTVSASVTGKDLTLTSIVIFTPVTDITMTNAASVQAGSDLTLTGIVSPANATNQSIVWSVVNANGTGATIVGSTFRATSAGTATVKATVANGSTASSDYTKTFDITVTTTPVVTHTITATTSTGGSISPSGSVTVNSGTSQTFTIAPTSNYSIADVKADGVSQGKITSYTFSKVTANHTISATFSYNGSSGGSSSNDNSILVIVTPPTPDNPNSSTQGEIRVPGTADDRGNITVNVTDKTVTDAFDKALEDARKNGNEQKGITVVLRVNTDNKTGSKVTINLPKMIQDAIIEKKIVSTIVVVDNPGIRISMDLATVREINQQAKADVNITATRTEDDKLADEAKKAIGTRPVFDLVINYDNGKQVQNFGTGSVSVTIPYTLGANEKARNVQAVYVDSKGKVHWLENSIYDSVEKVLRFSTAHFSTYGVGYRDKAQAERIFGQDRYQTALEISRSYFVDGADTVILTRGDSPADALPAVTLAKKFKAPLLLTPPNSLPEDVLSEIKNLGAKKVIIVGGEGAVSHSVENWLKTKGLQIERLYGATRYETAYAVAKKLAGKSGKAILVNGNQAETTFADALSISTWAGNMSIPILYVDSSVNELPKETNKALQEGNIIETILIGGEGVLPFSFEKLLPNSVRYSGKDRYGTNIAILQALKPPAPKLFIATGADFADALAGAAVAAQVDGCFLLVGQKGLTSEQQEFLRGLSHRVNSYQVFGGPVAVPEHILGSIKKLLQE